MQKSLESTHSSLIICIFHELLEESVCHRQSKCAFLGSASAVLPPTSPSGTLAMEGTVSVPLSAQLEDKPPDACKVQSSAWVL